MLVSAVQQLQVMTSKRQYKEAATQLELREELINNFCSRELTSYEQIYVGAELKTLDEIELIYNQLSCLIRKNQGKWTIFPASWHVPYRLCIQLSRKTRVQVESILVNLKEKSDVEKLLLELKRTLEFERELEMKFGGGGSIGDDIIGGGGNNSQKFNFRGMISSCYEPHLTIYIEKEEMELMQLLEKVVQEETWDIEEESQTNILSSSIQLFFTIKRSLKRCSALTKNQTLFNLFKVFQRVLNAYATKLFVKLPKGGTSIIAAATGMDGRIKVSEKDERMICYIVNTADYCHKTSGDLVEEVSTIIHPPYADGVDISEVQDAFSSVITSALVTLVHGLETKFDKEMADMTRVSWGIFKSVGDQSNNYVYGINTILCSSIPVLGNLLTPVYFQFFLDKLALSLGQRFYVNIFRCKHISETGAQQMLLDAHDMKMILLKVPSLARQTATASYVKFVNHQMKRAEAVLKVIASPIVTVIDTYRALFPEETPMEFQRILVLKGLTKAEQQSILDDFNNHSSRITQLSVAAKTPEAHALPLALTNVAPAVRFKANSEEVLTRAASAATTSFMKLYALTGAAKDRPFRKLFNP
ncbi:unnamed protein product [Arabidopsis thaliana]|uniref:(thale cress) hypothetical protein n=1 Tax=Arabidopsis thaliana TaxID=3702 RepID=A0A7G2DZV3_ARATH|nr:unnamed protein product [Arabidopsis thaliana]